MMTIIVDVMEPKDIEVYLNQIGIPTLRQKLKVGDYIVGDILIERKTISDLFGSVFERGKFWRQMEELAQSEKRAVIIEGMSPPKENIWKFNTYWGINFGIMGWHTPIFKTNSKKETARVLKELYRRLSSPHPFVRPLSKVKLTKKQRMSDALCSVRGLGRRQAEILLEHYVSVWGILNTPKEKLYKTKGIRRSVVDNLLGDFME